MTTVESSRPVPLSRVWSGDRVIAEDLTGEDLSDVLELNAAAYGWWVLPRDDQYGAAELKQLAGALELDEYAVRDLLATDRRAKFDDIGQARLVITNAASVDHQHETLTTHPVSIIATDRVLICLVEPTKDFQPARLLVQRSEQLAKGGVEAALQAIVGAVINTYENALQWLEDSSDGLAEALFEERPLTRGEQLKAFRLRSALSQLRRLTDPMRAVMTDLGDYQPVQPKISKAGKQVAARHWRLLAEKHTRVANAADALREALASIFDASLALADVRMNQIMKKLTAWAAIIAVPTLVTSFVGMNVTFPLVGTVAGFLVYSALMIVAGVLLYFVFRRRDWV